MISNLRKFLKLMGPTWALLVFFDSLSWGAVELSVNPKWQSCGETRCYSLEAPEAGTSYFFSEKKFVREPVLKLFKKGEAKPYQVIKGRLGIWTPSQKRWTIQSEEKSFYFNTETYKLTWMKEKNGT